MVKFIDFNFVKRFDITKIELEKDDQALVEEAIDKAHNEIEDSVGIKLWKEAIDAKTSETKSKLVTDITDLIALKYRLIILELKLSNIEDTSIGIVETTIGGQDTIRYDPDRINKIRRDVTLLRLDYEKRLKTFTGQTKTENIDLIGG